MLTTSCARGKHISRGADFQGCENRLGWPMSCIVLVSEGWPLSRCFGFFGFQVWILFTIRHFTISKGCHVQSTLSFWQHFAKQTLQCKGIFNCKGLNLGIGPEAARSDVGYTRDNVLAGLKNRRLFQKGHCRGGGLDAPDTDASPAGPN